MYKFQLYIKPYETKVQLLQVLTLVLEIMILSSLIDLNEASHMPKLLTIINIYISGPQQK